MENSVFMNEILIRGGSSVNNFPAYVVRNECHGLSKWGPDTYDYINYAAIFFLNESTDTITFTNNKIILFGLQVQLKLLVNH